MARRKAVAKTKAVTKATRAKVRAVSRRQSALKGWETRRKNSRADNAPSAPPELTSRREKKIYSLDQYMRYIEGATPEELQDEDYGGNADYGFD